MRLTFRSLAMLAVLWVSKSGQCQSDLRAADSSPASSALRVLPADAKPDDSRLRPQRTLNDAYHPWSPPTTKEAWEVQAERIRRQVLLASGLWPMPEKTPLEPVIHGLVDRGDITVERVFFASRPGMYVTGSLVRPKTSTGAKRPAVLCPHGHWQDGRFYDAGPDQAAKQLAMGAESFLAGARFPLQSRMIQLAKMGCVVFFYDAIGVADNAPLVHRADFNDATSELWLQNKLGLHTWNSIRALDFVSSLPDVDAARIGVTGASGGGTQTFLLTAVDPRVTVSFPAVMVGTGMQGGCVCENASYLRIGLNNVALAAASAPRPLGVVGAKDWTIDIETKGLPELKAVYALLGHPENVTGQCLSQFPHNYNEASRELMYAWLATHLGLKTDAAPQQSDFWPLTREELTVFDAGHVLPEDAMTAPQLADALREESIDQLAALTPKNETEATRYRDVIGAAAAVMFGSDALAEEPLELERVSDASFGPDRLTKVLIKRGSERVPMISLSSPKVDPKSTVVWIDGRGKSSLVDAGGALVPLARSLLDAGCNVVSGDVFLTGEFLADGEAPEFNVVSQFPAFTFCYNRPLLTQRVRDVLTIVAAVKSHARGGRVQLLGTGDAGLWVLLAHALDQKSIFHSIADLQGFRFSDVHDVNDARLLPGALKYGDVDGLAALIAPGRSQIYGASGNWPQVDAMNAIFSASIQRHDGEPSNDEILEGVLGSDAASRP